MTPEIISGLIEKSISIGILAIMVWYFMRQIDKKDAINTENQTLWMNFAKESTSTIVEAKNAIVANTAKLESLHSDMIYCRTARTRKST